MLTSKTLYVGIEQVQKLIEKDDKPISQKEAAKQEEKIQKIISKRRSESVRVLIHSPSVLWTRQKLYQAKYSARTRVPGRDDGHRRGKQK